MDPVDFSPEKLKELQRVEKALRSLTMEELNLLFHIIIDYASPPAERIVPMFLVHSLIGLIDRLHAGLEAEDVTDATPQTKTKEGSN